MTHDLLLILEKALALSSDVDRLRDALSILMPYAVEIRYPDDWYMPSEQDTKEAREAADQVLRWLKSAVHEIFQDCRQGGARTFAGPQGVPASQLAIED